ncbi:MAG: 30S ribosomal protein S3 [Candidatus Harrisonbacteria bacterium CG10_big_fil_rev_8_21_14_0_10_49_15]|uniref:Small ribosomal subunit protein uS3 n=1 Tax=Candidatus Harrisonbacteria bacterium CG10_big_fil_rev_8_21_14_0_10_49_15 TaxID=1974587 RepID=A0A2H0UKY3_9BACT|nr:MAG: 30S ribosomal protein S3 [Candidatus Harrisonbacteria bacterium CG10_big_fil_rev_8_21_14_0_10_49_15]
MGQKIRPDSFRLGITQGWTSRWFPKRGYKNKLEEDVLIRRVINDRIKLAGIVRIEIERNANNQYRLFIKAAKPGIIIGRGGAGIEDLTKILTKELQALLRSRGVTDPNVAINLNIEELKRTEIASTYVAQTIAWELEKRMPFRRTIKKTLEGVLQNRDVKGAKIQVAGRLDGGEIARSEFLSKGKLPLQTLRANIDYGRATAYTTYGTIGIKVWVYKGDIFSKDVKDEATGKFKQAV